MKMLNWTTLTHPQCVRMFPTLFRYNDHSNKNKKQNNETGTVNLHFPLKLIWSQQQIHFPFLQTNQQDQHTFLDQRFLARVKNCNVTTREQPLYYITFIYQTDSMETSKVCYATAGFIYSQASSFSVWTNN